MSTKILVTGATGQLGSAVVKALTHRGFEVKAASTNPAKVSAGKRVAAVKMDYTDPATFDEAFKGVDRLFLIALPLDPDAPEKLRPIIDKAKTVGVNHIVFNSALGVDHNEQAPLRIIERYLMGSGVNYTILRPNFFMENFATGFAAPMIKAQGGIFLAAGDGKTSFISTGDIAEAVAAAFAEKHYGKEYNLTGPQALDHVEVAAIVGEAAGRQVTYHSLTEDEMLKAVRESGVPEGSAQYLALLYSLVRAHLMAAVTDGVMEVTGRKPKGFREFAQEHRQVWK
ncbi:MAG: SDR family oxidoreductase [Thermodesulfobacteriota bacterium]